MDIYDIYTQVDFLDLSDLVNLSHCCKLGCIWLREICRKNTNISHALHFLQKRNSLFLNYEDSDDMSLEKSGEYEKKSHHRSRSSSLSLQSLFFQSKEDTDPTGWFATRSALDLAMEASKENQILVLKWLRGHHVKPKLDLLFQVVGSNNVSFLRWCSNWVGEFPIYELSREAARKGDLALLEWFYQEKKDIALDIVYLGAINGKLTIVKWGREHRFSWNQTTPGKTQEESDSETLHEASLNGHSRVVRWCYHNGCPGIKRVANMAAGSGKVNLMKWAVKYGSILTDEALVIACQYGRRFTILWSLASGCHWTPAALLATLRTKQFGIMKWIVKLGCPVSPTALEVIASTSGNVEIAQWLHERGAYITADTKALAIENGFTEMYTWLMTIKTEVNNVFEDPYRNVSPSV